MCTSDSQKRTIGMGARAGLLSLLKIVVGTDHGKRGLSPLEAFLATGVEDGGFCQRGEWGSKGWHFEDGRTLRKGAFWWNGGVREALYRLRTVCFSVMDRNSGDQGQHHSNNEDSIPA